jgi:hypothetical protein
MTAMAGTVASSPTLALAACAGANPRLFDQTDPIRATHALAYCRDCPVSDLCLAVVRPSRSHYDGVAGGQVWSNGKIVGRLHGTRQGTP